MPKSVLVADDSLTIRKVIGMLFNTEDFSVTVVDNGLDAISRARELRPDLVLADCMMPGKSGYEVCEVLKRDPATSHIPVMLLAGTFEPFDEGRAKAAGANGHIAKPFDSTQFLDRVKGMVGLPAGSAVPASYALASSGTPARPSGGGLAPGAAPPGGMSQPRPMPGPTGAPPMARPPAGIPPQTQPGVPGPMMRPPMPGGPGVPMRPPMSVGAGPTQPGVPNPMNRPGFPGQMGVPGMPPGVPGMRPGGLPPGTHPGMPPGMPGAMRPPGPPMAPGMPGPQPFPRPPGAAPLPGAPVRRDPFGLPGPPAGRPPGIPQPPPRADHLNLDGGEAHLREALSKASREVIEKIAWEVVPQLAETIIREELHRLMKEREAKGLA